ncbi:39S ribosomal protein L16, mitochondrial [Nymphon striatum]|nr:39S ribosomal protein L16, mitochondrial [Nymphon striatum]
MGLILILPVTLEHPLTSLGSASKLSISMGLLSKITVAMASMLKIPMTIPKNYDHVHMPEKRKLPVFHKVPQYPAGIKPQKSIKRLIDLRGPELVHNEFTFKQYGIVALHGGELKYGHFEMIRLKINRKIDVNKMFAMYRVDPPWKAKTKKGIGKRMGGGKGPIHHYTTPIKAGRVILEIGGKVDFGMVKPILDEAKNRGIEYQNFLSMSRSEMLVIAVSLPFKAKSISHELMLKNRKEEEDLAQKNLNPWTFEYMIKNNMQNCRKWAREYDKYWYGKYE